MADSSGPTLRAEGIEAVVRLIRSVMLWRGEVLAPSAMGAMP